MPLTAQPFAGDDGSPDPALAAALTAWATGRPPRSEPVLAALAGARLLVAVRAMRTETGLAVLTTRQGQRALPVFSGQECLTRWDPSARPVPVEAARAALAAVAEDCSGLIVDIAGPVRFDVARPALWALATGRPWTPAPDDVEVLAAVDRIVGGTPRVLGVRCEPGSPAELRVIATVEAGLTASELDGVLDGVRRALAQDQVIAERVESMELRVVPGSW